MSHSISNVLSPNPKVASGLYCYPPEFICHDPKSIHMVGVLILAGLVTIAVLSCKMNNELNSKNKLLQERREFILETIEQNCDLTSELRKLTSENKALKLKNCHLEYATDITTEIIKKFEASRSLNRR